MATDKRNELLVTYTSDVHALVTHGIDVIARQRKNLEKVSHADAKTALAEFERALTTQKQNLDARIKHLGGTPAQPVKDAVSAVAGVAAGLINAVRPSETAKSMRDDHTFFSQLGVAWLMLHTTAAALGDVDTALLAERCYAETARCVIRVDAILPKIIVEEIRESISQVSDATEKTRQMVRKAWERDSVGASGTSPSVGTSTRPSVS